MSCHMMQFSLHSMHKYSAFEATSHVHIIFVGGATKTCQQHCRQRLYIQHFSKTRRPVLGLALLRWKCS